MIITIIIGIILSRSIHLRCSVKKGVLRNFTNFTGKYLCQRFFFNKVAGHSPETLLKKSLCHRCFTMNFAKLLRTPFLKNTSGRLLLLIVHQTLYETIRVSDSYSCSNQIQLKTNSLIIFKIHCSYEQKILEFCKEVWFKIMTLYWLICLSLLMGLGKFPCSQLMGLGKLR